MRRESKDDCLGSRDPSKGLAATTITIAAATTCYCWLLATCYLLLLLLLPLLLLLLMLLLLLLLLATAATTCVCCCCLPARHTSPPYCPARWIHRHTYYVIQLGDRDLIPPCHMHPLFHPILLLIKPTLNSILGGHASNPNGTDFHFSHS